MMLKSVGRCIAGVVVLGVMTIAGCAPVVEEEVVEEPIQVASSPFAEVDSFDDLDDAGRQALEDLRTLISNSSVVEVRIMGPAGDEEPTACNRRLHPEVPNGYIIDPGQVTWRVQQDEPDLWMEGDSLFMERKSITPDRCFGEEPFTLLYPDLEVRSGPPLEQCVPNGFPSPGGHPWDYSVELRNTECSPDDNPVDKVDPVVIIEPGFY